MILICDDDQTVRSTLSLVLRRGGYEVALAENPAEAVSFVRHTCPELILMDMNYSRTTTGEEGLELLSKVKVFCPGTPVILITAWGSIDLAVRGIKAGAFDFVTKPWNNLTLLETIRTAIQLSENTLLRTKEPHDALKKLKRDKIIGKSPLLNQVLETVARVAPTNAPVLLTGESGTGKELIAEAIHENSGRSLNPFVKVNLGGVSQSLFESEMFGHRRGAFTDAHYDRKGRFELADNGSIFLDEIGELDLASQVKLLRVLQDQTFEVLGDSATRRIDTRIISATNRNLADMVAAGIFREDLFYRINLITIRIPSLRERAEDIPLLADHFARLQAQAGGMDRIEISADAMAFLKRLPYPGNIRELKNLVERTILISGKQTVSEVDFRSQYTETASPVVAGSANFGSIEQTEKNMILKAIELYGGNISRIATALGLSRQALYRRIEKYGIKLTNNSE
ncbi:sigma-54 dependent transcriptional regulator [uncultured Alistipes sp.]|uniref:sigma-54-dependent transcriptional regulator n=1 Tax=uncultured Alistipes sp. TaxID=538949 RepID=UPI0025CCB0E6|nr:sigma-54 dependent transcriptional regulator [uncultured Alistipes sp.]